MLLQSTESERRNNHFLQMYHYNLLSLMRKLVQKKRLPLPVNDRNHIVASGREQSARSILASRFCMHHWYPCRLFHLLCRCLLTDALLFRQDWTHLTLNYSLHHSLCCTAHSFISLYISEFSELFTGTGVNLLMSVTIIIKTMSQQNRLKLLNIPKFSVNYMWLDSSWIRKPF